MSSDLKSIQSQFNINADKSNAGIIYEFERFRLNSKLLMLYEEEKPVALAPKVVETLLALIERRGEIVSKDEMMRRLWADSFVDEANLTQNIYLLRKTLGKGADGRDLIETFRRRGYRFTGKIIKLDISIASNLGKADSIGKDSSIVLPAKKNLSLSFRSFAILGVVLLTISGLIFFYWLKTRNSIAYTVPANISLKRLTQNLTTFNPAISPDGKYVAYARLEESRTSSLWLQNVQNGEAKQLLPPIGKAYLGLQFAPDSKHLYYLGHINELGNRHLNSIDIESGATQEIVQNVSVWFALSPNGKQVAFVRNTDLFIAETDGSGTERTISSRDGKSKWFISQNAQPAWSADGQRIIISGGYLEQGAKHSELVEINVSDSAEKRIQTPSWDKIGSVLWIPDNSGLFVIAREEPNQPTQIFYLSLKDGTAQKITKDLHNYNSLSLTADARFLVTEQAVGKSDIWLTEKDDLTKIRQVTFADEENTGVNGLAFMSDGKIVYTSPRSGNIDIWVMNADGSNQKQLTSNMGGWNVRPRPSPDGRYIVFQSFYNSQNNIWRMDADGKNLIQLTNGGEDYNFPDISPDSQWVFYTKTNNEDVSIWKISINGGSSVRVSEDNKIISPSISPDGKLLAVNYEWDSAGSSKVNIISTDTGKLIKQLNISAFRRIIRWSPDSKSLIYIQKNSPNLWEQSIEGGQPRQITNFNLEQTWNFAFSQDNRKVAIVRGSTNSESVLIHIN